MSQLRRVEHNMVNSDFGKFYVVHEHRTYIKFFNERYDIGNFYN